MKLKLAGFAVLLLVMSGCAPSAAAEPTAELTAEPTTSLIEESAAGKIAADAVPCAQDAEGMQFYADEAHGFCVLIPDGFSINQSSDVQVASFVGTMTAGGYMPLGLINVTDAGGKSAAEIAAPAVAETQGMGLNVTQQTITVGGEEAIMVDGLSGQDVTRKVFVVHGGTLYEMSFTPSDPNLDTYASVQALYDSVVGTFAFLR